MTTTFEAATLVVPRDRDPSGRGTVPVVPRPRPGTDRHRGRPCRQDRAPGERGVDGVKGVRAQFTLGTLHEGSTPFWGGIAPCPFPALADLAPSPMAGERGVSLQFDPDAGFQMTSDGPVAVGGGEFRVNVIHDGFADEICEAWDSEDCLVMRSTQLTAIRIPADATPPPG